MQTRIKTFFDEEIAPLIVTTKNIFSITPEHKRWIEERDRENNPKFYITTKAGRERNQKQSRVTEF